MTSEMPATLVLDLPILTETTCNPNVRERLLRDFRGLMNTGIKDHAISSAGFSNIEGLEAEELPKRAQWYYGHTEKYLYLVSFSYYKLWLERLGIFCEDSGKPLVLSGRNLALMRTEAINLNQELKQLTDNQAEINLRGEPRKEDAFRLFQTLRVQEGCLDMIMGKLGIDHIIYGNYRSHIKFKPQIRSIPGYKERDPLPQKT